MADCGGRGEVELHGKGGIQLEKSLADLQAQQEEADTGPARMGCNGRQPAG